MKESVPQGGRWLGWLIFSIGLLMMLVVFGLALISFLRMPQIIARAPQVTQPLALAVIQIGILFVMAYLSSLFASKGLEVLSTQTRQTSD